MNVSPSDYPVMPQAVGARCHKCGLPHRFVDGKWQAEKTEALR